MKIKEIWKPVIFWKNETLYDFTEAYEVSNLGGVRSLDKLVQTQTKGTRQYKGKNLSPITTHYGYLTVNLTHNKKRVAARVHRLVLAAFVGFSKGQEADHINRDKKDNRLSNLRYCTRSQNNTNKHPRTNMSSEYVGVTRDRGKWQSAIRTIFGKLNLGRHHKEADAAATYNVVATLLHGDFASLNPMIADHIHMELARRYLLQYKHISVLMDRSTKVKDFLKGREIS